MGEIIQFVPRNAADRRPMLEQIALGAVESISVPKCHDDLTGAGGCVLDAMYESSLGYVDGEGA